MKSAFLSTLFLLFFINTLHATAIDTTANIQIGGIEQFVSIQGKNTVHPILLYLHGGPGQAASAQKDRITAKLEENFVVVHWDQRNSGQTLKLNAFDAPVTLDRMKKDAEEVFMHLLKRFKRSQLIILSNSWGTVLGFHLAHKYPKQVQALFAVSPSINATESQKIALQRLIAHFTELEHKKALEQLSAVQIPHETIEQMIVQYRWQSVSDGQEVTDEQIQQYMPFFLDWEQKWMPIYKELYSRNLAEELPELHCPVYFFVGKKDYNTNFKLTEAYFEQLKAPTKEIFWFDTGHNILKPQAERVQEIIAEVLSK
ncbi:MAG: alpha/beta hydrolase [Bacteroidota bacterium]